MKNKVVIGFVGTQLDSGTSVRRVCCRAWLAAQTLYAKTITGVHARLKPPNVMGFYMVDYDARKEFTYLKSGCFARLIHPTILWKSPIPVCRAEHWRFCRDQPEGARQGSRALPKGQGSAFWQTPIKTLERRKQAASGGFLLDTFLCPHKEKYLVRGYENPH
jgi:hypothetical protein